MKVKNIAVLLSVMGMPLAALATNGMNMEGYGPIATGMGGASMAFDNGNAAMINNPATLGFMKSGTSRLDIALGGLHPNIGTNPSIGGGSLGSSADAFFMPALGYVRKDGKLSWGLGMMAQGGMGTEYENGSIWGTIGQFGVANAAAAVEGAARRNRSEVGVGRVIAPLAYEVSDSLNIGGSLDYVWAGMDIQWLVDGAHFGDMVGPAVGGAQVHGKATGSLVGTFADGCVSLLGCVGAGAMTGVTYGYFDFSNSNKFTGEATGKGWAGNIGFTYRVSPTLTVGGVYHAKTRLSDMETSNARIAFNGSGAAFGAGAVTLAGTIKVVNFQWPETYGIGLAYQASDKWMVVADWKRIGWAKVMQSFNMTFVASNAATNGTFAGKQLDIDYYQRWKNQNILNIGAAYKYSDLLTVRFGANLAQNPVPDQFVTPLFPATIKNHLTFGMGYGVSKTSSLDFSLTHAPKVTVSNNWSAVAGTANQTISHSQTNWQLMYSHRF